MTLGCSKNEVISQKFEQSLLDKGLIETDEINSADYIIINSCGFIEDALNETIEETIYISKIKKKDSKVILTGCATTIYKKELKKYLYEADYILDYNDFYKFFEIESYENTLKRKVYDRKWEYLLISEGCSKYCTFCTIPLIKGDYRSFPIENLVNEAKILKEKQIDEIILISQDTAYYGIDIYKNTYENPLQKLVENLSQIGFSKIRILYFNLDSIENNDKFEYIKQIFSVKNVVPYFEIPLQHLIDAILKKMGRRIDFQNIELMLYSIKKYFTDSVIRTSIITGFPGETEDDYLLLKKRLMNLPIDYLNVFAYSDMEKAASYKFKDKVERKIAIERRNDLISTFEDTLENRFSRFIDKEMEIIIEQEDEEYYIGRLWLQAPDLDGLTYISKNEKSKKIFENAMDKRFKIKVLDSYFYDFYGEFI